MRTLALTLTLSAVLYAQVPKSTTPSQPPNTKQMASTPLAASESKLVRPESQSLVKKAFAPETWPQWALLFLGIVGAFFAYHTVIATKNSADAAHASAEALIGSERGLILVTMGQLPDFSPDPNRLEILYITPILKNYGKTAATITRMVARAHQVTAIGDLPAEPTYSGDRVQDFKETIALPPDIAMQPLNLGISGLEWPAIRTGQIFLYIYGFVQYSDAFDRPRESRFCYLYHVPGGYNPNPVGFYISGPQTYNRCT